MARPRLAGGRLVASRPSISIVPGDVSFNPAISRRWVDLQQTEGPTKTTNSPFSMVRSIAGMTCTSPNDLRTLVSSILPMMPSLHRAEGQAADQLLLAEPAKDKDRCDGHGAGRRQFCVEQPL